MNSTLAYPKNAIRAKTFREYAEYGDTEVAEMPSSQKRFNNPNVPLNCTQEEFVEYIRSIEQGPFTPWEESQKEFEAWKKERLARYFNLK
jgi:hypothetical protein